MANGYLVEIDNQEREHEAILRLFEIPFISNGFFAALELNPPLSWYLLEIREQHFRDSIASEVDILAGRIEIESGKIDWSHSTRYLVAIEAKLAYFDLEDNQIKSQKSSPQKMYQIQSKIEELIRSGFDKVALLDMIANPPASGQDGRAWLNALYRAFNSIGEMPVLKERLPNSAPAGHWVWSIGSVIGGDEMKRGAGAPIELRKACNNRLFEVDLGTKKLREEIRRKLGEILSRISLKSTFPLVFLDCRICGRIHGIKDACNYA